MGNAINSFIRHHNTTFNRCVSFFQKTEKGERVQQFERTLRELAENRNFETCEENITREIFIKTMLADDIQRELLRDTVRPEKALNIAKKKIKMGYQNQQQISSNNASGVNIVQQVTRFRGANAESQQIRQNPVNREPNVTCIFCAKVWKPNQRQFCIAMGKKCKICSKGKN